MTRWQGDACHFVSLSLCRSHDWLLALGKLPKHVPAWHALANPEIGGLDDLRGSDAVPALDVAQQPAERGDLLIGQARQPVLDADCDRALVDFALALPSCAAGR